MNKLFLLFFFASLAARGGSILTIDNVDYSLQQFYAYYPKKQWSIADSTQRERVYTDFIKRMLCVLEAKELGFENVPDIAVKIRNRSQQILVNETYEHLVAFPLISPDDLSESRNFARYEILASHILVGYSDCYLPNPPNRSIDDALLLAQNIKKQFIDGTPFSSLVEKYSNDPSATKNLGSLGWVGWGQTVRGFQSAAFGMEENILSNPVWTQFGYHLILITDRRPSDFQYMSEEEYESAISNISKGAIRDQLRSAAIVYDSLKIEEHGVLFNLDAVFKIKQDYVLASKEASLKNNTSINAAERLFSFITPEVVCVYGGGGYGLKWFANKIRRIPLSKQPVLDSEENIMRFFKTIILQDIAVKNGFLFGVDHSFSFIQRRNAMVSDLLYDSFLKHLINSVPSPDSGRIKQYYNQHLEEHYTAPGSVLVREIRVKSYGFADSLFSLLVGGVGFDSLAQKHSLINPHLAGLSDPITRKKNRSFFDAVSVLEEGETTSVLSAPNGQFSILYLVEKTPGDPINISRVYSNIESLLLKEDHVAIKGRGVDGLLKKYSISRHSDLLSW